MWRQAKKGALYLYRIQTMRERATFALLICLTTLTAYIEFGLIKAIGPVVALTGTSQGHSTSIAIPPPKFIDFEHHNASDVAAAFMVLALASAGVRIVHVYIGYSYVYRIGHIISSLNLSNALDADYILLKSSHSSVLLARFEKINMVINSVLVPILTTISSVIIGAAIILSLLAESFVVSVACLGLLATFYWLTALISRRAVLKNSEVLNHAQGERVYLIREAITGYRELKISGILKQYSRQFNATDYAMRFAQVKNLVLANSPRFLLEALGLIGVSLVILITAPREDISSHIVPLLATFGIGAQRLLPHIQSIYSASTSIAGHLHMVKDIIEPLFPNRKEIVARSGLRAISPDFQKLHFRGLEYTYPASEHPALSNIELTISRGEKIALIGSSGSGKSTFLEILCGLLDVTVGKFEVDGIQICRENVEAWQHLVAYVPQQPYLATGSIRDNLVLGTLEAEVSEEEMTTMLKRVGLLEWVTKHDERLDRSVGENGGNLSGGQRQRLAIARALIGRKKVIVMDEITSQLDATNASAIIDLILSLPREYTVICSLHQSKGLERFDAIVTFSTGRSLNVHRNEMPAETYF